MEALTKIIIVCGLPGSGKSYFAERLAERLNAEYVSSDRLRKELFSERIYSASEKTLVYNVMLEEMKEAIRLGRNLVLDGTFHTRVNRELFKNNAEPQVAIFFIEVQADERVIRERLKRSRPYSEADFKIYKLIRQEWEPMNQHHLKLQSNNENIAEMLEEAEQYLNREYDKRTNQ